MKTRKIDQNLWRRGFHNGVLAALAIVDTFGSDTLYDEIVRSVGKEALIGEARRIGDMRFSGLSRYLRRNPPKKVR